MDWDELAPKKLIKFSIGDDLKTLSIAELEMRIAMLDLEIGRIRDEIKAKKAHEAAAASIFKR